MRQGSTLSCKAGAWVAAEALARVPAFWDALNAEPGPNESAAGVCSSACGLNFRFTTG